MPEFVVYEGKVKARRAHPKTRTLELTVPSAAVKMGIVKEGQEFTPVFNRIIIYVPDGVCLDLEKLKEAVKEEKEGT